MAGTDSAKRKPISIDEAAAYLARKAKDNESLPAESDCDCAAQQDDEENPAAAFSPGDDAADTDGAETRTGRDEEAEEEGKAEDDASEQEPLEPPKFWDAKAKKRFGALPRDVQEIILHKEDERNAATARALQETAEKRKAAEEHGAKLGQLLTGLDLVLNEAAEAFRGRWHQVDWNRLAGQVGAEKALALRNQHDMEMRRIQQIKAAKDASESLSLRHHVAQEEAKLASHAPELADPKLGGLRKAALAQYLAALGMPADRLTRLTALEAAIAYDAMKWRNGQSQAQALAKAKPTAQARRTPAKPTAAASPRTTHQARIGALSKKRELSIEEAVELANLRGQ